MSAWRHEKPSEIALVPADRPAAIEASAGTGKTYTLEHVVVDLLLTRRARIESILVVTFTEKATFELTSRLRRKLAELLAPPESATNAPPERCWTIDEGAREILRQALVGFDRASISTLHAFCQRVLCEHAFQGRRLFQQAQVEEEAAFGSAFKEALRRELACAEDVRPYLGAWLARRDTDGLERLLRECHRAHAAIRPTFDADALEGALAALRTAAPDLPALVAAARGKIHPSSHRVLERRLEELAKLAALAPEHGLPWFLDAALEAVARLEDGLSRCPPLLAPRAAAARAAVEAVAGAFVPLPAAVAQLFLPRVRMYLTALKERSGLFDFHDMVALVAAVLDGPRGEPLARTLRARYPYALVDEFQDTDDLQWRILERLFFANGEARPLYVIGDPKQAIYGFRGADVRTYLAARRRILGAGGAQVTLQCNFRSTKALVEAQNLLLDPRAAPPFFSGEIRYEEVSCGRPELAATDAGGREVTPVHVFCVPPAGTEGRVPVARIRRALAVRIAAEIRSLCAGALHFGRRPSLAALKAKDIFVLTRTIWEGYELGRVLRSAGVPHAYYKQDGLFQTEEASHVRDLLAGIDEVHDRSRRYRAWITPFFGVALDELTACEELAGTEPLLARLFAWKAVADRLEYDRLFARIVEESGIARRLVFLGDERALTNYFHLFEILTAEVQRRPCTLGELVRRLGGFIEESRLPEGEAGNVQRLESERDAVQIMTMHKSKGLEAPVVFLYGGLSAAPARETYLFHEGAERAVHVGKPRGGEARAAILREAREEDERLLYVAITRAKARLYLPCIPGSACRQGGSYAPLNAQLHRLLAAGDAHFTAEDVLCAASAAVMPAAAPPFAAWRPSRVPPEEHDAFDFAELRERHAGFSITSYTRMKELSPAADAAALPAAEPSVPEEGELPGGAAVGVFLHEMLERVDLTALRGPPAFAAWRERADVRELFRMGLRTHDLDPRHLERAQRLVHAAWTAPLRLGDRRLEAGFAAAPRVLRELEFLFPHPEPFHAGAPYAIGRGYVKGFVDLVFEHDGTTYFADWKSDLLRDWDPAALERHVREHYELQARLYSLALVRMLEIEGEADYDARFGGLLYCFLRAMPEGGGVHFARPSWRTILGWEEWLMR